MAVDVSLITEARAEKLKVLAANRQQGLTVILENIYDPHNLGAVLRTCDSVGIAEVYALYTVERKYLVIKVHLDLRSGSMCIFSMMLRSASQL